MARRHVMAPARVRWRVGGCVHDGPCLRARTSGIDSDAACVLCAAKALCNSEVTNYNVWKPAEHLHSATGTVPNEGRPNIRQEP